MIIPALDLINGKVVRLFQGDYCQETEYSDDPIALLKAYEKGGAEQFHLVDLTGAKSSNKRQITLLTQIVREIATPIQVGAGLDLKRMYVLY